MGIMLLPHRIVQGFDVTEKQVQQGEDLPLLLALAAAIYLRQFRCREVASIQPGGHSYQRPRSPHTQVVSLVRGFHSDSLGRLWPTDPGEAWGVCGASSSSSQGRSPSSYPILKVSGPGACLHGNNDHLRHSCHQSWLGKCSPAFLRLYHTCLLKHYKG